jgi:hypothetical protein
MKKNKTRLKLTEWEMMAILCAASHMEDDFEDYYNYSSKRFHLAFHNGMKKIRQEIGRIEQKRQSKNEN